MSTTLSLRRWRLPVDPSIVVEHSRVTVSAPVVVACGWHGDRIDRRVTVSGEPADVEHAVSILTGYGARVTL